MKSFELVPTAGTWRTRCCRAEWFIKENSALPLCPQCRKETTWALILSSEIRHRDRAPAPEGRSGR